MRNDPINATRRANFKKATKIRQAGYKSSIHALPRNVKAELDTLLSWETTTPEAMRIIASKYPDVKFPDVTAVNRYRKKYIDGVRPKDIKKAVDNKVELVQVKSKLEKSGVARLKWIDEKLLPLMEAELIKALIFSKKQQLPITSPIVALSGAYKDLFKTYYDILRGNDAHLFMEETTEDSVTQIEEIKAKELELDTELDDILKRRGVQIQFKRTKKVIMDKT